MSAITVDTKTRQRITPLLTGLLVGAGICFALGALVTPGLVWSHLLLMCFYVFGLGMGCCLFLAFTRLTGARWCTAIQVLPESVAKTVPLIAPLLGVVVLGSLMSKSASHADTMEGASFWFKNAWLRPEFFVGRTIFYLVLFPLFAWGLAGCSKRSRESKSPGYGRLSALFLVVFAIVFSAASVDWLMALSPEWFSTMWGVYQFAGAFLSGLAIITLLAILLDRAGPLSGILKKNHLHILGILLFSFSSFWMYIWFSQYMLIWYTNMPEETFYFAHRVHNLWGPLFITNIFLNWVIPFFVLLPRPAKQNSKVMLRIAIVLLAGRWLDLYLAIIPATGITYPLFGFCAIGSILGTIGLFGWMVIYVLRRNAVIE